MYELATKCSKNDAAKVMHGERHTSTRLYKPNFISFPSLVLTIIALYLASSKNIVDICKQNPFQLLIFKNQNFEDGSGYLYLSD